MALQKLDKKQVPQVAALAVLSCGLLGYFAHQMITPSPAAARTAPPPSVAAPRAASSVTASPAATTQTPSAAAPDAAVPQPPAPGMRDPFQQTISSTPAMAAPPAAPKTASLNAPHAPSLPVTGGAFGMAGVRPLPAVTSGPVFVPTAPPLPGSTGASAAPTAPLWQVTGVLASGAEHVAILRSGTERRFVRQGDWLDSQFQVTRVDRSSVSLRHGALNYTLPLGGGKGGGTIAPAAPPAPVREMTPAPLPPSAVSARPTVHKTMARPLLASAPRAKVAKAAAKRIRQAPLLAFSPAPLLSLATPALPMLQIAAPPVVRVAALRAKPVVKVAAYHAQSTIVPARVKSEVNGHAAACAVPPGMLAVGTLAPDFSLPTLDGHTVTLSQLRGRPVVLTFWASWVGESGQAVPQMAQIARQNGAAFVPVGSWDSRPALLSFAGAHNLSPQDVLCDDAVSNASVAVRLFRAPDVPTCYVLDGAGRVAAAFVGFNAHTASAVRAALQTL